MRGEAAVEADREASPSVNVSAGWSPMLLPLATTGGGGAVRWASVAQMEDA